MALRCPTSSLSARVTSVMTSKVWSRNQGAQCIAAPTNDRRTRIRLLRCLQPILLRMSTSKQTNTHTLTHTHTHTHTHTLSLSLSLPQRSLSPPLALPPPRRCSKRDAHLLHVDRPRGPVVCARQQSNHLRLGEVTTSNRFSAMRVCNSSNQDER